MADDISDTKPPTDEELRVNREKSSLKEGLCLDTQTKKKKHNNQNKNITCRYPAVQ